jgi:PBP1b-binding outer membrane lipoprotein LpoB
MRSVLLLAVLLSVPIWGGGCTRRPEGIKGRVDPRQTTRAEMRSNQVLPAALLEFADQMPQTLAQRIATAPQVRDTPGLITIVMGDIANKTDIVSTSEFELMVERMRSNLLASATLRERLRFVESRARLEALARRELGVTPAELPKPVYDPATSYAMVADVFRIGRGDTNLYAMHVQLTSFATGAIVFDDRFEVKQVVNP